MPSNIVLANIVKNLSIMYDIYYLHYIVYPCVQAAECGGAHHLPARLLRAPHHQEVVGAGHQSEAGIWSRDQDTDQSEAGPRSRGQDTDKLEAGIWSRDQDTDQ